MVLDKLRKLIIELDLEIAIGKAYSNFGRARLELFSKGLRTVYAGKSAEAKASKIVYETYTEELIKVRENLIGEIEEILKTFEIKNSRIFLEYFAKHKNFKEIAESESLTINEVSRIIGKIKIEVEGKILKDGN